MKFHIRFLMIFMFSPMIMLSSCSNDTGTEGDLVTNTTEACTTNCDPILEIDPKVFNLSCYNDRATSATLNILNGGGGELSFKASVDQSWIEIDSNSGKAPDSILITINCVGMSPVSYNGLIKINDNESSSFKDAIINLTVSENPPGPVVSPNASDFFYDQFGTSGEDKSTALAVDSSTGDFYIAGATDSELLQGSSVGGDDIFLVKYDSRMIRQWIKQWGSAWDEEVDEMKIDSSGNLFLLGTTYGDLDDDSNDTTHYHKDFFLAKYDSDGNEIWTEQIENPDNWEDVGGMAFDSSGNIYVTGFTKGQLPGHTNLGQGDIFLFKFDPNGNVVDSKQFGSSLEDRGVAVVVDSLNNVYVIGISRGDYDGQNNIGNYDIILTKFSYDGFRVSSHQWGTISEDEPFDAEIDSNNNIVIAGVTYAPFMGNPAIGQGDIFILKVNSDGEILWSDLIGSALWDEKGDLLIDPDGDIFVTGSTYGDFDGNTSYGEMDLFLTRYDSGGEKLYSAQIGSSGEDFAEAITIDSQGNLYLTGFTEGEFGVFNSAGSNDIFTLKLPYDY